MNARINLFTQRASEGAPRAGRAAEVVDEAREAGTPEEAYRAIVNFIWSASGVLSIGRTEAAVLEGRRRAEMPPPPSIAAYLELSRAVVLLIPAGRGRRPRPSSRSRRPESTWRPRRA